MLDKEYKYFTDNKERLFEEYPNKFVIIIGESVVNVFDTLSDAYTFASEHYAEGQYLIDQCTGVIKPQIFHSRVQFAKI